MGIAPRVRRTRVVARADASGKENALAPAELKSPTGEMLQYYLKDQPHLFEDAVDQMLTRLSQDRAQRRAAHDQEAPQDVGEPSSQLSLSRRMEEVRIKEAKVTVEDVMYMCVVERFTRIGIDMMPPLDAPFVDFPQGNLKILTEGVHSKEALELVREHLMAVMGPAMQVPPQAMVRMCKLQAAQVYAASVMFGYFIRQVDRRFQLDKALGTMPEATPKGGDDAVARLERLFQQSDIDEDGNPLPKPEGESASSHSSLRRYVESFDQQAMAETARLVSLEGAALVERQTTGLFGSVRKLQEEMKKAIGDEFESVQDLMKKIEAAVTEGSVQSLTMSVGTQRRMVLEAVAYGTFLRDVESKVDSSYELLTPISSASSGGTDPGNMAWGDM